MKRILTVPLFPLPRTVLFPGVMLPFYIFEPRYRKMLADCLDGPGLIGMPLLLPGFESDTGLTAPIASIFGIGSVEHYEHHDDGTSHVQILGRYRARRIDELPPNGYRQAQVEILDEINSEEPHFRPARERLNQSLETLLLLTSESELRQLLRRLIDDEPEPARTINILTTLVVGNAEVRQSLLEENDVIARGVHLSTMIETLNQELRARGNLRSREEEDRDSDL